MSWSADLNLGFQSYGLLIEWPYAYVSGYVVDGANQKLKVVKLDLTTRPFSEVDSYTSPSGYTAGAWYRVRSGAGAISDKLILAGSYNPSGTTDARIDIFDKDDLASGPIKTYTKAAVAPDTSMYADDARSNAAGTIIYWCGNQFYAVAGAFNYDDLSDVWFIYGIYSGHTTIVGFETVGGAPYVDIAGSGGGVKWVARRNCATGFLAANMNPGIANYVFTDGVRISKDGIDHYYLAGAYWPTPSDYAQGVTHFRCDNGGSAGEVYRNDKDGYIFEGDYRIAGDENFVWVDAFYYAGPGLYEGTITNQIIKYDLDLNVEWVVGTGTNRPAFYGGFEANGNFLYIVYADGHLECRNKSDGAIANLEDNPPAITSFTGPAYSKLRGVWGFSINATNADAMAVTESSSPPAYPGPEWAGVSEWPVENFYHEFDSDGEKTLYAWVANSASGEVSSPAQVTVFVDTQAPAVTAFGAPATVYGTTVVITAFAGSDQSPSSGGLQYVIIEDPEAEPTEDNPNWSSSPPTTFEIASFGEHTLCPFVMDAAGNISAIGSHQVEVTTIDATYEAAGGFVAGGPAEYNRKRVYPATDGGPIFGGEAAEYKGYRYTATDGIIIGGFGVFGQTRFIGDGGVVIGGVVDQGQNRFRAIGGVVLGGVGPSCIVKTFEAAGGFIFGGTGQLTHAIVTASGGLIFGGKARLRRLLIVPCAPIVKGRKPRPGETAVALNYPVTFYICGQGGDRVDIARVVVTINGVSYSMVDPEFSYSGDSQAYLISVEHPDFLYEQAVTVVIAASSLGDESMTPVAYGFTAAWPDTKTVRGDANIQIFQS